ncbi:hypothetical protein TNCV_4118761 [Trichonephila clavipes]|nr:hypothetical protein TNCV_4118761 [Trichonephila clavipes]
MGMMYFFLDFGIVYAINFAIIFVVDIIGEGVCSCSTSVSCKSSLGISNGFGGGEAASSADISGSNEIKVSLSHRLTFPRHVRAFPTRPQPDSGQLEEREVRNRLFGLSITCVFERWGYFGQLTGG